MDNYFSCDKFRDSQSVKCQIDLRVWLDTLGFFFVLEGSWGQPQGPNFPSPWATMLDLRLDCSTAALTTSQKVLPNWKLVELKMLDFSDRTSVNSINHFFWDLLVRVFSGYSPSRNIILSVGSKYMECLNLCSYLHIFIFLGGRGEMISISQQLLHVGKKKMLYHGDVKKNLTGWYAQPLMLLVLILLVLVLLVLVNFVLVLLLLMG